MQINYARYPGVVVKRLGPWQNRIRLIVHLRAAPAGAVVFLCALLQQHYCHCVANAEAIQSIMNFAAFSGLPRSLPLPRNDNLNFEP